MSRDGIPSEMCSCELVNPGYLVFTQTPQKNNLSYVCTFSDSDSDSDSDSIPAFTVASFRLRSNFCFGFNPIITRDCTTLLPGAQPLANGRGYQTTSLRVPDQGIEMGARPPT